MTPDEERISEIEARVRPTFVDGAGSISERDFETLMASWLAWKMTAKCFAVTDEQKAPSGLPPRCPVCGTGHDIGNPCPGADPQARWDGWPESPR